MACQSARTPPYCRFGFTGSRPARRGPSPWPPQSSARDGARRIDSAASWYDVIDHLAGAGAGKADLTREGVASGRAALNTDSLVSGSVLEDGAFSTSRCRSPPCTATRRRRRGVGGSSHCSSVLVAADARRGSKRSRHHLRGTAGSQWPVGGGDTFAPHIADRGRRVGRRPCCRRRWGSSYENRSWSDCATRFWGRADRRRPGSRSRIGRGAAFRSLRRGTGRA
jgi:hypothetical protein